MPKLNVNRIREEIRKYMGAQPSGARWSDILRAVEQISPETPKATISTTANAYLAKSDEIEKVARGYYRLKERGATEKKFSTTLTYLPGRVGTADAPASEFQESSFYQPFADWLRDELEDVAEVMVLGGNFLKEKWGTPDVIGVLKAKASDVIKFAPQIVSAEIKTDTSQTIVAFGQAVAYRLFSHKSYIVIPEVVPKDDLDRLEALAIITGVGLVTFKLQPNDPDFRVLVRAALAQPDMYYVNDMARKLQKTNPKEFNKLFS